MHKNILLAMLLFPVLCFGQGVRFGDGQPTIQAQTVSGKTNVLRSLPSSIVNICGATANAVPCTNKVLTYTDSTLITACSTSTQLVLAGTTSCVGTSDSLGNWGVWLPSGQYSYTITDTKGNSTGPFNFTLATGNGGTNGVNLLASGVSYTFTATDSGKLVLCQNSAAMSFMLPIASTLGQAWGVRVQNVGLGICTISAAVNNIDGGPGSAGLLLAPGQGATIEVDQSGTPQYWTMRGIGFTGTYTGASTFNGDMSIVGNLNVSGQLNLTGAGAYQLSAKCQALNTVTVPSTQDFSLFCGSDGIFRSQTLAGLIGSQTRFVTLASNYTNATTTMSSVTGLAFAVSAATKYKVTCNLVFSVDTGTALPNWQFTGPASPTTVLLSGVQSGGGATPTSLTIVGVTAFSTPTANASAVSTSVNYPAMLFLNLQNGANAGTIQLQAKANGAGTLTILAGSMCEMVAQ